MGQPLSKQLYNNLKMRNLKGFLSKKFKYVFISCHLFIVAVAISSLQYENFPSCCFVNFLSACFPSDIRAKSSFSQDDAAALAKHEDWRDVLKKIPDFL